MKRIALIGLVIFFLMTQASFADSFFADDLLEGRWGLSFFVNRAMPDGGYDTKMGLAGAIEYNWAPHLSFEMEAAHLSLEEETENLGSQSTGELNFTSVLTNVKWRFYSENQFYVFVFGGVGMVFPEYQEATWISQQGVSVDLSTGFAYQFGGGLDYYFNDNFALVAKVGRFEATEDAEYTATWLNATDTIKTEMNHLFMKIGLEFLF
ncbi:OmpW family outer membrane protein [Candidatus Omnitrophota bacterium]